VSDPTPRKSERQVLSEPVATRVLARAIELDQARASGTTVADLRAAADEVGVSAGAFDAALAEVNDRASVSPPVQSKTSRRFRISVLAAGIVVLVAFAFATVVVPRSRAAISTVPMEEEAIVLRCLSPSEATELIRPLLHFNEHALVRASEGSRVLTVRATAEQLKRVKSLLDQQQSAGSPACAVPLVPPGSR